MDAVGVLALGFVGLLVLLSGLAIFTGILLIGDPSARGEAFVASGGVGMALAFALGRFARGRLRRPMGIAGQDNP